MISLLLEISSLAVLVYKALKGPSPQYLADDCKLTSTADFLLSIPVVHTHTHMFTTIGALLLRLQTTVIQDYNDIKLIKISHS